MDYINTVPDLVLRNIFALLPVRDLLRVVPKVCRSWRALQPSVRAQCRALTLLIGAQPLKKLIENTTFDFPPYSDLLTDPETSRPLYPCVPLNYRRLDLPSLSSELGQQISESLPHVRDLVVGISLGAARARQASQLLIQLLEQYSLKLKKLKIYLSFNDIDPAFEEAFRQQSVLIAFEFVPLIESINQLPLLEHLTLNLGDSLEERQLDLPILSRLKEFYFLTENEPQLLFQTLKQYGESNKELKRIALGSSTSRGNWLAEFGRSSLKDRFVLLAIPILDFDTVPENPAHPEQGVRFERREENVNIRERFFLTFCNIESLWLTMPLGQDGLGPITKTLSALPNLKHFHVNFSKPLSTYDSTPDHEIYPLPSVLVLNLILLTNSHKDLESKHWPRIFPNLQIIHLNHSISRGCSSCGYQQEMLEDEEPERMWRTKIVPCVRAMLRPLKYQLPTLKRVIYCLDDNEDEMRVFRMNEPR